MNALAHVAIDTLVEGGVRYVEISTTDARLVIDGYAMLMAVADRVQLDGIDPLEALKQTLATWQSILATRVRMSLQAEVGLFGEVLLLGALLETGAAGASAWRGGLSEEHDFGFIDAVELNAIGNCHQHGVAVDDQPGVSGRDLDVADSAFDKRVDRNVGESVDGRLDSGRQRSA